VLLPGFQKDRHDRDIEDWKKAGVVLAKRAL
jgi:hypothetical protein